jgi:hypothetical protein
MRKTQQQPKQGEGVMKMSAIRVLGMMAAVATVVASGCNKKSESSATAPGVMERAGSAVDTAAQKTSETAKQAATATKDAAGAVVEKTGDVLQKAGSAVEGAGADMKE